MAVKLGCEGLVGVKLIGIVWAHPYFWGTELVGAELTTPATTREYMAGMWRFACPSTKKKKKLMSHLKNHHIWREDSQTSTPDHAIRKRSKKGKGAEGDINMEMLIVQP
ncbi:putative carboxylesterase 13 [Prunus yedoensis var. nudiflora]|uniref:Putative carboxylesterase 13 n=1 Tax=Prunus yedoensis var. nudiflora TaxID=2094558 RepID=A0A314Z1T6_PRUYE|nr:putative carboxylesterase 13 [Prunus yedoensis var. nudiflora]